MIVKTLGRTRSDVKARERNGLEAGWKARQRTVRQESLRRTEGGWQHFYPQRGMDNDSYENSSWQRDWTGNPERGKKTWQELGILPTWGKLCVLFFFSCGA